MPPFTHVLSSGLFSLPSNAMSVDWAVINDSPKTLKFKATVFRVPAGTAKVAVAPGAITHELKPAHAFHNANDVGSGEPFEPGFYYELVVETNDLRLLPSVHVWQDKGNAVIPGTLISPGTFVDVHA
jgi:hypothetical protein